MTREEAIHFVKCLKHNYTINFADMEVFCDMVIKALEQEPCEDAVSRQAVLNTLDKRFDSIPVGQTTEILLLRKDLRELPSVTLYKVESEEK